MKMQDLFELPERTQKPRQHGITMIIDSGLGFHAVEDGLSVAKPYLDYVKLGWGTAIITPDIGKKVAIYKSHGVPVCLGGTFFELAYLKGKIKEYRAVAVELGLDMIEISDGTVNMLEADKLRLISEFAKDFRVLSEYGSKDAEVVVAPSRWVDGMRRELEAGAWKSIAEGRESGTAGLYRATEELRTGLVDEIVMNIPQEMLIWEAPKKHQQVWFIKKYGSNVNLGNIALSDIIALETLRLGLRGDTLMTMHGDKK